MVDVSKCDFLFKIALSMMAKPTARLQHAMFHQCNYFLRLSHPALLQGNGTANGDGKFVGTGTLDSNDGYFQGSGTFTGAGDCEGEQVYSS